MLKRHFPLLVLVIGLTLTACCDCATVPPTPTPPLPATASPPPTVTPTPEAGGWRVVLRCDFEDQSFACLTGDPDPRTGRTRGGVWDSGSGHSEITDQVAYDGRYAVAAYAGPEKGGTREAWRGLDDSNLIPDETLYRVHFYFPHVLHPVDFLNAMQWKSAYETDDGQRSSDPTASVNIQLRGDQMVFSLNHKIGDRGETNKRYIATAPAGLTVPTGRWVELACRYVWAVEPEGEITCWQDGVLLWDLAGLRTEFDFSGPGYVPMDFPRQVTVNNYSGGYERQEVIYIDGIELLVRD